MIPALLDPKPLMLLERGRQAIAEARAAQDFAALKDMRDKAQAVCDYLRKQRDTANGAAVDAAELKLRAEHALGEVLTGVVVPRGNHRNGHGAEKSLPPEIGKKLSHVAQRVASVPESQFDAYIATCRKRDETPTTTGVTRIAKEAEREAARAKNREQVTRAPQVLDSVTTQFPTIVLDPPWDWGDEGDVDHFGRGRPVYDTMPLDKIAALPVADLAQVNTHLYLWITNRSLPKGFALLDAWGFRYVTCLTWCKPTFGLGNYFRGATEHVLFGVRGSLPLLRADAGTWFAGERPGRHSGKPEDFYKLVESCSPGPWLEMFAREQRNGWTTWGAEA